MGVEEGTAVLPNGWKERLVPISNANTRGAIGLCLEAHDLLISKHVAGREKDLRFARAAVEHALVEEATLLQRLADTEVGPELRARIEERIRADFRAG